MTEQATAQPSGGKGMAIAAMVLGILSIIFALLPIVSIPLGLLAIIFGILAIKKPGRGMAIAGLVTGIIGLLLGLLIFVAAAVALPSLQKTTRDNARRVEVNSLSNDVLSQASANRGRMPSSGDLSMAGFSQIKLVTSGGEPTTDTAVYDVGENCDGVSGARNYSVSVKLEDGETYCTGSL